MGNLVRVITKSDCQHKFSNSVFDECTLTMGIIDLILNYINPFLSGETCDSNYTMCPTCDRKCPYWNYSDSCSHVTASQFFDNDATVIFTCFMCVWGKFLHIHSRGDHHPMPFVSLF